ncbi:thiamine-phosphate kinase [Parvularcula lutaonensis]|uniref:Thiamine-monophosphate kinase n=1 Tax=Parvularcula lutaonensis TaxID=491923 RepID=A0ABV7MCK1_9PROT|nr:thiamine-phosphate kinase [Parvularcula lutaonensis]GGY39456.1 thiamine-monophosphate kinase [Parvularcula lutaonensis]
MGEFERIARFLAPLAGEGAEGLKDDAAYSYDRVLTKDVLVEGVHFLSSDPVDLVARKALRVNQSDVIAKGATPEAYLLGLVWPKSRTESAFADFCAGLELEQRETGLKLLGGDTTAGDRLLVSVTMFGMPVSDRRILRSGGQAGDLVYVSGTIGDGLLGLEAAKLSPPADDAAAMPYRVPRVPFGVERLIADHATASLDVSDGLVADAGHLAEESGVQIIIDASQVPLSDAGRKARAQGRLAELLTAGDDYQSLILAPADAAKALRGSFTAIGRAVEGEGVIVLGANGEPMELKRSGWDHFGR